MKGEKQIRAPIIDPVHQISVRSSYIVLFVQLLCVSMLYRIRGVATYIDHGVSWNVCVLVNKSFIQLFTLAAGYFFFIQVTLLSAHE